MARFSAAIRATAGTVLRPMMSVYAAAASAGALREVGCFNTTATAVEIHLVRLTTTGTQGTAIVEARHNPKKPPNLCAAFTTHTANATLGEVIYGTVLGAAIGSGVIWTFGDDGLVIGEPDAVEAVGNGVGIILATGTGQICQCYMVWDE